MPAPRLSDKVLRETVEAVDAADGNISQASRNLGVGRSTFEGRYKTALQRFDIKAPTHQEDDSPKAILPEFGDDDIPIEDVLNTMQRRFEVRAQGQQARKWFTIEVDTSDPIAINFVGDPHIDSPGCNIPLLRRDVELMSQPGHFCLNLGDTTDGDWPGRLMKLHAESDQSITTARRLADWFLNDTGLRWLAVIIGNHDAWGDGAEILRRMNVQKIPMLDWTARFKVKFANERELKILASHSFPGHSWINPLHSNQRREMVEEAHIYASGHKHDWGIHQSENGFRGNVYTLLRARGYKFIDQYAENLGYPSQQFAATVCAVVEPRATSPAQFVKCFADLAEGAEFLAWKRGRK